MTPRRRRIALALAGPSLGLLLGATAALSPHPRLIWNASASAPIGLYAVRVGAHPEAGELVAATPPEPLASLLAARRYLPSGVPLLKHVTGVPGQSVCRSNFAIRVDGAPVGSALARDRAGRDLPIWQGCRRIGAAGVFLMNTNVPDSFDGRYFGPIAASQIIGRAVPLWTKEHIGGRFEWRAPTR